MTLEYSIKDIDIDVRKYDNFVKVNNEFFNKHEAIELASRLIEYANDILSVTKTIKDNG